MKKYRKQAGVTQEKLAELCDTDPAYIGQIETGRRFPSVTYIEKIAAALCIAPHLLFYDELNENKETVIEKKQMIKKALLESVSRSINSVLDELY
jgi:transcriptional regulator with XRE-family HTH domain